MILIILKITIGSRILVLLIKTLTILVMTIEFRENKLLTEPAFNFEG